MLLVDTCWMRLAQGKTEGQRATGVERMSWEFPSTVEMLLSHVHADELTLRLAIGSYSIDHNGTSITDTVRIPVVLIVARMPA